jgi:hypothetical protein
MQHIGMLVSLFVVATALWLAVVASFGVRRGKQFLPYWSRHGISQRS